MAQGTGEVINQGVGWGGVGGAGAGSSSSLSSWSPSAPAASRPVFLSSSADMSRSSEQRSYLVLENFIGGKFVPCGGHVDSYDPSTGEVYCKVPDSGVEEVGRAGV